MSLNNSIDHDKKIKIEKFLKKLSAKKYSEEDIRDAEKTAETSYKSKLNDIWDRVRILFMIAKHPKIWGPQIALLATVAVIYLVSPVDVIPDFIPVGGLTDDIAVIGAIAALIIKALSNYTRDKLSALRDEVPDDLRAAFDEMFKFSAENEAASSDEEEVESEFDDIKTPDDLSSEQKGSVISSVENLGSSLNDEDVDKINETLPTMNKGPVKVVWDKVLFMADKFRNGCSGIEKVLIAGALLYLILPTDVIPDFIPCAGLIDDVFAITYVYYKIGGGKEKVAGIFRGFTENIANKIKTHIEPVIEAKVKQEFDKMNKDRLLVSLINLLIYLVSVLLVMFPVFGTLPSAIISSVLLIISIGFAVYRFVKFLRNGYSIPIARSIIHERNIKNGISSYIRSLDRRIPIVEKYFDSYFRFIGEDTNRRALDKLVDYVWKLQKKNILIFIIEQAFIILIFFIVRYALMKSLGDLSFWRIVFYPFFVVLEGV